MAFQNAVSYALLVSNDTDRLTLEVPSMGEMT